MVEQMRQDALGEKDAMKVYSIKEAAELLHVSRTWMYYLIQTKRVKARKIGAQYTVSQAEIDRYRDGHDDKEE